MAISRLFVEIGGDTSKLDDALKKSVSTAQAAGLEVKKAGERFISAFDSALNPTKRLEDQIRLLSAAGKSNAEIMAVMGDKIRSAVEAATRNKQPIDAAVLQLSKMGEETKKAGLSFESLGQTITEFARNPIQSAQQGMTKILEGLGPMAVGLGAVATAAGAAAVGLFEFVKAQSDEAEALENLSAITGITVKELSALKQISKEAGLEGIDLGRMIGKLNQELGDNKPNEFTKAAERMGLSIKTASGQTKDAVTVLDEMRIMLLAIEDPTQRAQLANQLLGGRLRELIPLILNSKQSIADLTQVLIDQGVVVSDLAHKRLLEFDTKMDLLNRSMQIGKSRLAEIGAAIFSFAEEIARANPKLNVFAATMAFIIGGQTGLDAYNAAVGNTAAKTRELTDAEKDLHNKMIQMQGFLNSNQEDLKKDAEAKKKAEEAAKKLSETITKLGAQYKNTNDGVIAATLSYEAWSKKIQEEGSAVLLKDATKAAQELKKTMDDLYFSTVESMGKTDKGLFKDQMGDLPKFTKDVQDAMDNVLLVNKKTGDSVAEIWRRQVSTIATDFSKGFADILFAGKSFGETLKNIFIDMAKSIVRALTEILFAPLQRYLIQILTGLGGVGTAAASTGGGGIGGVGGLAGLGGLAGIAGGAGGLAAMLMPGGFGGKVAGGIGTGMLAGAGALYGGLIPGMGAASFGSALGFMGSGAGLFGAGGLMGLGALSVPAIGAAAIGLYYGIKALIGKSTQTAGAMEVQRDLAVSISKDVFKSFTAQFIDPSQAWGIRKDLYMSPAFLSGVAGPAAQAQGQMPAFLKSLENIKTSWGTFNFRQAFELGNATGDWSELNKQFTDAFEHSTELQKMLPDWRKELMAVSDATKDAADSTADLTDKVYDIIQRFRETGEVLPQLRELFQKFGGDLKVLDDAAQLPGLQRQVGFINDLVGRMQALTPQATVLEEIFSGAWKPTTAATLTGMGIDPNKLKQFTSLTGMTQGWDQAVSQFQQSGNLTPGSLVYQGIQQYGGTAGQVALQRLAEGFNTITPQLLSGTFATMQEAYQKEITSALDYLGTVQKTATDKLDTLTAAVETELTKVSNAIVAAVNNGDKSVTDILNAILVQLGGTAVETAAVDTVQTVAPGTPSQPPVTGDKPTIIIQGPIYGYDDFAAKVERAAILLQRRGSAAFATA